MPSNPTKKRFEELITQARVMTLATSGKNGPWAAPVYYLYRDKKFYFFSSPNAQHIQEGLDQQCAAAVFSTHACVEKLEGLQMSGTVMRNKSEIRAAAVAGAYARRFGISFSGSDPLVFFQKTFQACLYVFAPDLIYYMDNRQGFGCREQVDL